MAIVTVGIDLTGMEARPGAHRWALEFAKLGHTVRLRAPKFVARYCMSGKLTQPNHT